MDSCKHCTLRGNLSKCEEESCSVRSSWYVEFIRSQLKDKDAELQELQTKLAEAEQREANALKDVKRMDYLADLATNGPFERIVKEYAWWEVSAQTEHHFRVMIDAAIAKGGE